jgi:superfamily II helicase
VYAVPDEDLERETPEKTSAVHFLRWEFTPPMIAALKAGAALAAGIDHPAYSVTVEPLPEETRRVLVADLD